MNTNTTRNVTTIPATISRFTSTPINEQRKRKTAAYARVSTDSEEQATSYEAQVDYYTNYIKSRDDWEFVDIYKLPIISTFNIVSIIINLGFIACCLFFTIR